MNDIVVEKNGNDFGYISITKAVGSLGKIEAPDVVPPVLGGAVALLSTLVVRKYAQDKPNLRKYAPLIGAGIGVAASVPMYWWRGAEPVITGAVTAVVVGGGLMAYEQLSTTDWALNVPSHTDGLQITRRPQTGRLVANGNSRGVRVNPGHTDLNVPQGVDESAFGSF